MLSNQRSSSLFPLFMGNYISALSQKEDPQDPATFFFFPHPVWHLILNPMCLYFKGHSLLTFSPCFSLRSPFSGHVNRLLHRDKERVLQVLSLLQSHTLTHTQFLTEKVPKAEVLYSKNNSHTASHVVQAAQPLPWLKSRLPLWAQSPSPHVGNSHANYFPGFPFPPDYFYLGYNLSIFEPTWMKFFWYISLKRHFPNPPQQHYWDANTNLFQICQLHKYALLFSC